MAERRAAGVNPIPAGYARGVTHALPAAVPLVISVAAAGAEVVDSFPPDGPPVLWVRDLGQGYSGITAGGGRVYTQAQTLTGGQALLCLDAETGGTLWRHRYAAAYEPAGLYPGPRSTPVLSGDRVFFTTPDGTASCLDAATGEPVWAVNLFERFDAEPVAFGYSCSPTVSPTAEDGRVYLPVGGADASLVALDAATGAVVWHAGDDPASHVPAQLIVFRGRPLVLGYLRNVLVAHDRRTGERVWRRRLSTGYDEHAAPPVYREPHLWISGPFRGGSELLELTEQDGGLGVRTVWKKPLLSNDVCGSVLHGGHLYGFDLFDVQAKPHRPSRGTFRCVEFLTGEPRWAVGDPKARRRPGDPTVVGQATVLVAGSEAGASRSPGPATLILLNDTGALILARATPERYEELARTPLLTGGIVWTRPTLHDGRLYARDHHRAVCVLLGSPPAGTSRETASGGGLRTTDLTRSRWGDWTAFLLPVEPEYMMDAPTRPELGRRYLASLALLLTTAALAAPAARFLPSRPAIGPTVPARFRRAWWSLAMLSGATGTTFVGHAGGPFLFTWPLALYVAFHATARLAARPGGSRKDDLALVAFAGLAAGYFLLCRRLSLAFEWAYLAALPAAIPFALLSRRLPRSGWRPVAGEVVLTALGFTLFCGVTAGLLAWRYG